MKKSLLIVSVASLLLLGSCGENTASSAANQSGTTSAPSASTSLPGTSTSSTTPASSPSEQETYMVVIIANSGVALTADKTTAHEGDTITLTYSVSAGYTLVAITMNGTALELNNGTASFPMPNRDVTIKSSVNVAGDVVLNGDIAISLSKQEDGTYAAKNVTVTNDSTFCVQVTSNGTVTTLDGSEIVDNRKTFANIENSTKNNYLILKGGASYDFYYDPANPSMPFSIQRASTLVLPSDANSLSDLLYLHGIKSDPTAYPSGVNSVSFFDSRTSETYAWKKFNQASLATITAAGDTTPSAYVYKSMDNSTYTVVDTYREGRSWTSPLRPSRPLRKRRSIIPKASGAKAAPKMAPPIAANTSWSMPLMATFLTRAATTRPGANTNTNISKIAAPPIATPTATTPISMSMPIRMTSIRSKMPSGPAISMVFPSRMIGPRPA